MMQAEYGEPRDMTGFLFMTITGSTIISSLANGPIFKRFEMRKKPFSKEKTTNSIAF
ncbi:hypothetical protein [Peribacillus asahii]|uniref:hypothetical protein n=1 Tax=Peribacillus asahii TaxID=228899 RepID=UPI00382F754D